MKRDLYKKLLSWKNSPRRKPLLLQGARQVGKTYLLKEFGKREYQDLAYFNFEEDPRLDGLFEGRLDPEKIVERLSIYQNRKIHPRQSLVFFDEIQESEKALNSLKYFQEEANDTPVVAAGSLLGIKLKQVKSFPVGKVNFLSLHPLSFFEFLDANGKTGLLKHLQEKKDFEPVALPFHEELIELLKIYTFVGGMPEVVSQYVETKDFNVVREVQREILKAFSFDFSKHALPSDVIKISQIWSSIPVQLAKENKKFIFSALHKSARGREYENALQWLIQAGLIHPCYRVSLVGVPLDGYAEKNVFKIYLLDTGLLGAMSDLAPKTIIEGNELFTHFKGAFVENYVAQELISRHERHLSYWASSAEAEVDFLLAQEETIFPLEVKAGSGGRARSLAEYGKKYDPPQLALTSLANFEKRGKTCYYPLYSVALFPVVD